jgi:anaerobic C4-dicarboxylate transporter DcuA
LALLIKPKKLENGVFAMIGIELLVVLAAIYLGPDSSIGIGFAGGLGVLCDLGAGHAHPERPAGDLSPVDVIMIIASVICAIACMQLAGMDYLVHLAESPAQESQASPSPRRSSPT